MPTGCSHIGQYDRRCEECCSCPDAESCQDRNLACYAKAFSASADACIRCRFSEYCRDAREVGGFQVQHGRPDIRLDENYEVLADRAAANVTDPQETDFPLRDVALVEAVETLIADSKTPNWWNISGKNRFRNIFTMSLKTPLRAWKSETSRCCLNL